MRSRSEPGREMPASRQTNTLLKTAEIIKCGNSVTRSQFS
jgi:hypothetical protein